MSTTTRISTAERFGRAVGRVWRAYVCGERRVSHWLTTKGMPVAGATALVWAVKLTVLGTLLYVAFWLVLLLIMLVFVARGHNTVEWEEPEPEWRNGHAGFGLYTQDEYRIDPHDPSDDTT